MGIQPIDLQTLYTQMEKVGKQVATTQKANEDANVQQAESFNRTLQEQQSTVQEMKEYDKLDVNKDGRSGADVFLGNEEHKKSKKPKTNEINASEYFTDPELGRKIDFSR
ncbi:MAG: hypothetical protein P1P64_07760 [Treponemataceae bacterium]